MRSTRPTSTRRWRKGKVKIDGDSVVGYYPGDTFHGHKHEMEIKAGDWLHVPLQGPEPAADL